MKHFLASGKEYNIWRWQACIFKYLDKRYYKNPNNHTNYEWDQFGPGCLFGQEVSHWMPIEDIEDNV